MRIPTLANIISCISIVLINWACTENIQTSGMFLPIDPTQASESINLSDLVDSVQYIKLETRPESIMGRMTQMIIKRKYIYVADVQQDMVFVFDTESFTMNEEGELFVSLMFDQTFYQLSGWESTPVLTVDFGEYSIDNTIGLKSLKEQLRYFREEASNRAYFPVLTAHTEKLLAIFYTYAVDGGMGQQYIHLKDRNQIFHTQKIVDDVTSFSNRNYFCSTSIPFNHEIVYDENYLVDIILPSQYLKNERSVDVEGIGKITDQDNPIVLLMKLKE